MSAPRPDPRFGIFAYDSASTLLPIEDCTVLGEVALFGRVIRHERGYRAENATIRRLFVLSSNFFYQRGDIREKLSRRYDCDVSSDIGEFWKEVKEHEYR